MHAPSRRLTLTLFAGIGIFSVANAPSSALGTTYALNWASSETSGVQQAQSDCYRLSGTLGQAAVDPGISTTDTYSLFTGFWSTAPIAGQDQLFFNAFEACIP